MLIYLLISILCSVVKDTCKLSPGWISCYQLAEYQVHWISR